ERDRLDRTLDRVVERKRHPVDDDLRGTLERLARSLQPPAFLDHVASRAGDRVHVIPIDQVTHLLARDRATYAITGVTEHMLDMTIADLEKKLDPARFLRIHRAALVNLGWIAELHADFGGKLLVRLRDERHTEL